MEVQIAMFEAGDTEIPFEKAHHDISGDSIPSISGVYFLEWSKEPKKNGIVPRHAKSSKDLVRIGVWNPEKPSQEMFGGSLTPILTRYLDV